MFVLGVALGWFAVTTVARRLPAGRAYPQLVPTPPRLRVASPPELRLLTPPREEVAPDPEGSDDSGAATPSPDLIIRDRTKSSEVVELAGLPDWEANLRDKGHKRGFVIRIRHKGETEPTEIIQADGMLRAAARDLAVQALRERSAP